MKKKKEKDLLHLEYLLKVRTVLIGILIGGVFSHACYMMRLAAHHTERSPITQRNPDVLPADELFHDMKSFL